jgi:hypothetical protein
MDEFAIQLLFDKAHDGRIHVHSPNIPGLHLAGDDLESIRADIEPIVKDLLFHNSNVVVDRIRWVPSLEEVVRQMAEHAPEPKSKYLMIVAHAA